MISISSFQPVSGNVLTAHASQSKRIGSFGYIENHLSALKFFASCQSLADFHYRGSIINAKQIIFQKINNALIFIRVINDACFRIFHAPLKELEKIDSRNNLKLKENNKHCNMNCSTYGTADNSPCIHLIAFRKYQQEIIQMIEALVEKALGYELNLQDKQWRLTALIVTKQAINPSQRMLNKITELIIETFDPDFIEEGYKFGMAIDSEDFIRIVMSSKENSLDKVAKTIHYMISKKGIRVDITTHYTHAVKCCGNYQRYIKVDVRFAYFHIYKSQLRTTQTIIDSGLDINQHHDFSCRCRSEKIADIFYWIIWDYHEDVQNSDPTEKPKKQQKLYDLGRLLTFNRVNAQPTLSDKIRYPNEIQEEVEKLKEILASSAIIYDQVYLIWKKIMTNYLRTFQWFENHSDLLPAVISYATPNTSEHAELCYLEAFEKGGALRQLEKLIQ